MTKRCAAAKPAPKDKKARLGGKGSNGSGGAYWAASFLRGPSIPALTLSRKQALFSPGSSLYILTLMPAEAERNLLNPISSTRTGRRTLTCLLSEMSSAIDADGLSKTCSWFYLCLLLLLFFMYDIFAFQPTCVRCTELNLQESSQQKMPNLPHVFVVMEDMISPQTLCPCKPRTFKPLFVIWLWISMSASCKMLHQYLWLFVDMVNVLSGPKNIYFLLVFEKQLQMRANVSAYLRQTLHASTLGSSHRPADSHCRYVWIAETSHKPVCWK